MIRAILLRETRIALRAGGGTGLGLAFFLAMVLLSALGLGKNPELLAAAAPGTLWLGALLAGLLSLDRMFQADWEDGALDGLALAPLPLPGLVLVKLVAHWFATGLPLVALSPVMALMLGLPGTVWPVMLASLAIGTLGLSAMGAVGAALTLGVRRGGLLLSLLVMPLYVPGLIFGVRAITTAMTGEDPIPALALLSATSLGSLALAPWASAAALRANMG